MKSVVLPRFVRAKSLLLEVMEVETRTTSTLSGQKRFINNNMPQKPLLCNICFKSLIVIPSKFLILLPNFNQMKKSCKEKPTIQKIYAVQNYSFFMRIRDASAIPLNVLGEN